MKMTLMVDAATLVEIASMEILTANNKDAGPILRNINCVLENGKLIALATNRFIAGKHTSEMQVQDLYGRVEFRMTPVASKWILANVKKGNKWTKLGSVVLALDTEERTVTYTYLGASLNDSYGLDKYPQLDTLINDWKPATAPRAVKLGSQWLAKLGKLIDNFTKVDFWVMEVGQGPDFRPESGPLRATAGRYEVLIQPNIHK